MTGYMTVLNNLHKAVSNWVPGGCLLSAMTVAEETENAKQTLAVKKNKVQMNSKPFRLFCEVREGGGR